MKKGFTQVELLLVVGILAVLLSLGTVIFSNFARQDQLMVEARKIESLLNEARMKTVAGFSLGEAQSQNFGVYFQVNQIVLFSGSSYDSLNPKNQIFTLPTELEIKSISLPSGSIVFEKISGEVLNFDPNLNSLILNDQKSDQEKRISVQQLGTVKIENL